MDAGISTETGTSTVAPVQSAAEKAASEIRAVQGIQDNAQFQNAVTALAVSLTGARAGLLYLAMPGGGPAQCLVNRLSQGVDARLLYSPEVRAKVGAAVNSGRLSMSPLNESGCAGHYFLCVPVRDGMRQLVMGLLLAPEKANSLPECELLGIFVGQLIERREHSSKSSRLQAAHQRTRQLLELFYDAGREPDFDHAFAVFVDEIQRFVGCEQVAIGFGNVNRFKLAALSGTARHDQRGHNIDLIKRAMRESAGVKASVYWPPEAELPGEVMLSGNHDELLSSLGADAFVAIPLLSRDDEVAGVWLCSWRGRLAGFQRSWDLLEALTPELAVVSDLIRRSKPRGLRAKLSLFSRKAGRFKKWGFPLLSVALVSALFVPVDFKVGAECRVQPTGTRFVATPFNGIMEEAFAKPGDIVEKGQVLAKLDGREIRWRIAELKTRRDSQRKLAGEAIGRDDVLSSQLASLEADGLEIEIELMQWRADNMEVRAPIDGLILSGNLEKSRGVPVQTGQKLFEIAPLDALRLELSVADSESAGVSRGMPVSVRLEAHNSRLYESEVSEVYPVSEVQEEKNVFVAFANLENRDGDLRPGMRGRARILAGRASLGWVVFRKPVEFLRMNLWW
ncbi:MAG: efflux RND transporter periplasmic adaptor subunit [Verrucomicrobiales bacterium]|nr:efflux RND transporter periplasmic adaptor subunit [Verrucomicrobiales bacterium]